MVSEWSCEFCDGTGDASVGDEYVKCATSFGTGVLGTARITKGRVDGELVSFRQPNPEPDDLDQDLMHEGDR